MSSLDAQLAALQATVEGGQRETWRRFDGVDRRLDGQDNKLESIEREVKTTNGRVTKLEVSVPRGAVTLSTVRNFGAFAGWLVAAIFGLLKLLGKL